MQHAIKQELNTFLRMSRTDIARLANVNRSDVSNFMKGNMKYVAAWKQAAILKALKMSQTDVVLWHFETVKTPLTQAHAGTHYHIGRLSERVRELNARWQRLGEKTRIRNTEPQGIGIQAKYVLITGDDNA